MLSIIIRPIIISIITEYAAAADNNNNNSNNKSFKSAFPVFSHGFFANSEIWMLSVVTGCQDSGTVLKITQNIFFFGVFPEKLLLFLMSIIL